MTGIGIGFRTEIDAFCHNPKWSDRMSTRGCPKSEKWVADLYPASTPSVVYGPTVSLQIFS
jgi:hypothetical protein